MHDDLTWLAGERPQPAELDSAATDRARSRLLTHVLGADHEDARRGPRTSPLLTSLRPTPRHALRAATPLALTGALVGALLVIGHSSSPKPAAPDHGGATSAVVTHVHHVHSPLLALASDVRATTAQPGDATLVLRTQAYPDQTSMTGADLYTDSGRYFYSETESGLPTAIAEDDNVAGNGFTRREQADAIYAANGDLTTARERMADATYDPGATIKTIDANGAKLAKQKLAAALAHTTDPAQRTRLQQELAKLDSGRPLVSRQAQMDNMIWENSLDTLVAGAGNPLVRAGVLRLLSTVNTVSVADTTVDGRRALTITAGGQALPDDYREQLTVDADTGVPIKLVGGTIGRPPSVTVTYDVKRVNVSDIAAGRF